MLVIIDTNVLLISISSKSKYHWLYQLILDKKIRIAFTHDILTEYEEQLALHWNPSVANNVIRALAELSTAAQMIVYYNLNLIKADEDDNKFVDCAFAANADFIITNDSHFNILKNIDFPNIPVLTIVEFQVLLEKQNYLKQ
ncbi:MAG: putative toxin-antitoxin system toxin component, family [Mucilaginibacter sp.]|nr:putative toxin-antitoxin system toxin component, family [Mucilaginibacter sp.]